MSEYQAYRHDTLLRWRVTSSTRPEIEHAVELDANGGLGKCSCEHFEFRLQPKINEGNRCESATRCSHIIVARKAFTDCLIQFLADENHENTTTETTREDQANP